MRKRLLIPFFSPFFSFPPLYCAGRNDSTEVYRTMVSMEAYLWKKGKSMFHMLSKRFYLLSGNCMYYYTHKSDVRPKGKFEKGFLLSFLRSLLHIDRHVYPQQSCFISPQTTFLISFILLNLCLQSAGVIFLTGFIIERLKDEEMAVKGYYGFEIMHQDLSSDKHHHHEKRVLYCKSEDERDRWVTALQHAAHVVPIEDDYVIGKELGRGRFSIVCECVHKVTGVHCAVKIIDKATIEPEEKGLLRTEIAVLKLVNHPNIIRMEGLYESKGHIYIVMEMLKVSLWVFQQNHMCAMSLRCMHSLSLSSLVIFRAVSCLSALWADRASRRWRRPSSFVLCSRVWLICTIWVSALSLCALSGWVSFLHMTSCPAVEPFIGVKHLV